MWSQRDGRLSTITKVHPVRYWLANGVNTVGYLLSNGVKVLSPEMFIALGEDFSIFETSIAACVNVECVSDVPESKTMAGNSMVHIGTWESHIVPNRSFQQAEEARRKYGDMAVGLTHIRGADGVMPIESPESGTLEGVSSKTQRDEEAGAML